MKHLLIARGRPGTLTKIRLIQLAVLAAGLATAAHFGSIEWVIASTVTVWILGTLLNLVANYRIGGAASLQVLAAPFVAALGAGFALHWGEHAGWLDGLPYWSVLFLLPAAYALLLVCVEARKIRSEYRYLREQMNQTN